MRAVLLNAPDGPGENMVVTEVARVEPGPGEVLVAVEYAGCNFADTMMRRGIYPHPKGYPLVAGLEVAGTVTAVGPDVARVKVGDRVAGFSEDGGGFAEFCAIPAGRLIVSRCDRLRRRGRVSPAGHRLAPAAHRQRTGKATCCSSMPSAAASAST